MFVDCTIDRGLELPAGSFDELLRLAEFRDDLRWNCLRRARSLECCLIEGGCASNVATALAPITTHQKRRKVARLQFKSPIDGR